MARLYPNFVVAGCLLDNCFVLFLWTWPCDLFLHFNIQLKLHLHNITQSSLSLCVFPYFNVISKIFITFIVNLHYSCLEFCASKYLESLSPNIPRKVLFSFLSDTPFPGVLSFWTGNMRYNASITCWGRKHIFPHVVQTIESRVGIYPYLLNYPIPFNLFLCHSLPLPFSLCFFPSLFLSLSARSPPPPPSFSSFFFFFFLVS